MKNLFNSGLAILITSLFFSCQETEENSDKEIPIAKFSLAQWSFNRDLFGGQMTTQDFVKSAGEMGFEGVEYVSQFFQDKVENYEYLDSLNAAAKEAGVKNIMIQVDNIGYLCASDENERNAAVELGKKWIDASKYLGCSSMRVNAHGEGTADEMKIQALDGIGRLADYANQKGIKLIIENHGGVSSKGDWLADLVSSLADKNVGSLNDFHNWCYETKSGSLWGDCAKEYDYYKGFQELIGSSVGVSVKAFEFDSLGNEPDLNFPKFFKIMKDAGYDGYLGVEYEGKSLPSKEGILKTKVLAEKTWAAVYSE